MLDLVQVEQHNHLILLDILCSNCRSGTVILQTEIGEYEYSIRKKKNYLNLKHFLYDWNILINPAISVQDEETIHLKMKLNENRTYRSNIKKDILMNTNTYFYFICNESYL